MFTLAAGAAQGEGMRIVERGLPGQQRNPRGHEPVEQQRLLAFDDPVLAPDRFAQEPAVEPSLGQGGLTHAAGRETRGQIGRFPQGLARDGAGLEADAPEVGFAFDQSHALAESRGLQRGTLAARAGANDEDIIVAGIHGEDITGSGRCLAGRVSRQRPCPFRRRRPAGRRRRDRVSRCRRGCRYPRPRCRTDRRQTGRL